MGTEFERLWLVGHLIEALVGTAIAVTVEAFGDDEHTVPARPVVT
jgi:hypothetical protein